MNYTSSTELVFLFFQRIYGEDFKNEIICPQRCNNKQGRRANEFLVDRLLVNCIVYCKIEKYNSSSSL